MTCWLGIDLGTQGARALLCDERGAVLGQGSVSLPMGPTSALPAGWAEQDPAAWWEAVTRAIRAALSALGERGGSASQVAGIAVTSTSGTVVLAGEDGAPLRPALMYNDLRAQVEAAEANAAGASLCDRLGYRFSASFALPKLMWLRRHEPDRFYSARYFLSPTDLITGRLTGDFRVSDYSNALKMGYDLVEERWPEFIESELGIPRTRLPRIVPPGREVGAVCAAAAAETGLAPGTVVMAGMTDGCTSQISAGAVAPGQWNSTLGTTLVLKGVTRELVRDPDGRVYCHRHPDGFWLPGGASNTGGEPVTQRFGSCLAPLDSQAMQLAPTGVVMYPLARTGERFPFSRPDAVQFAVVPDAKAFEELPEGVRYTAHLEGVAFAERMAYDLLRELGAEVGDEIYAAGGATASDAWLQVRADVLGSRLLVPVDTGGAKGAAVIAAAGTHFGSIIPAAREMVRVRKIVEPRPANRSRYDELYAGFRAECRQRGYI